jgi:hypothetical protein
VGRTKHLRHKLKTYHDLATTCNFISLPRSYENVHVAILIFEVLQLNSKHEWRFTLRSGLWNLYVRACQTGVQKSTRLRAEIVKWWHASHTSKRDIRMYCRLFRDLPSRSYYRCRPSNVNSIHFCTTSNRYTSKVKTIPVQDLSVPEGWDTSAYVSGRLSVVRTGRLYHPGNIPDTHLC